MSKILPVKTKRNENIIVNLCMIKNLNSRESN